MCSTQIFSVDGKDKSQYGRTDQHRIRLGELQRGAKQWRFPVTLIRKRFLKGSVSASMGRRFIRVKSCSRIVRPGASSRAAVIKARQRACVRESTGPRHTGIYK